MDFSHAVVPNATVPLYIVQKSWFDGPHFEPSIDLPLLFVHRTAAELVATQSAHALCRHFNQKQVPEASLPSVVRTVLSTGGDYAFATCGKLFCVRAVEAALVYDDSQKTIKEGLPWTSMAPLLQAFCVLTNHVVGGTGNPNSRRGSEQKQHCVVLASKERLALSSGHLHVPHNGSESIGRITRLPVVHEDRSKLMIPAEGDQPLHRILQAWPDASNWIQLQESKRLAHDNRKRNINSGNDFLLVNQGSTISEHDKDPGSNKKRTLRY